jgi:hypothetical protein
MKHLLAMLAAVAIGGSVASAQQYPDTNPGYELGIQQLNTSGEVGSVTLFDRGPHTVVAVRMTGTRRPAQWVGIYRRHDCPGSFGNEVVLGSTAPHPAFSLSDLQNGWSVSNVPVDYTRLVSGNYNVVVFSSNQAGARPTACGHLYQ